MQGIKNVETKKDPRIYLEARDMFNLTYKQWRFCMVYVGEGEFNTPRTAALTYGKADGLASEGGSMDYKMANSVGQQNIRKPNIKACIQELLTASSMSPNEVMSRLSKMASANIADMLDIDESGKAQLNLVKARKHGVLGIVKKLNFDSFGNLKTLELHDAFAALGKLGQHHKLFDRHREAPMDPKELARELLDDLRAKHEGIDDALLISKVLERFSGSGVTESDLIDLESTANN